MQVDNSIELLDANECLLLGKVLQVAPVVLWSSGILDVIKHHDRAIQTEELFEFLFSRFARNVRDEELVSIARVVASEANPLSLPISPLELQLG